MVRNDNYGPNDMHPAADYRQYAQECRTAAESLKPGQGREQLLEVAAQWERLASEREQRLQPVFNGA